MRSGGFTLIEVLVALAIVVLGMSAVLGALSSSANTVSYLRDKTFSEWVALNQIANTRLQMQQQLPATATTTGEIDYAGRSWHWRQEIVANPQIKGMVQITVKVRPAEIKADDDNGWFITVMGIAGDAVASAQGTTPMWGNGPGGAGTPGGQLGENGATTGQTPTTGTSTTNTGSQNTGGGAGTGVQTPTPTPQPGGPGGTP